MQSDGFYSKLQKDFDDDYFDDKPDEKKAVFNVLREDAKELGLLGNCDSKICDGTHFIATARGRFMWMILEMQKNLERGNEPSLGFELKDVLEKLGVKVDFIPISRKVSKLFNQQSEQETQH